MVDHTGGVEWIAALDTDPQGWALARSVRRAGEIVDFELCYLNHTGARLLGKERADLVGRLYRDLWPETAHDGTIAAYRDVVESRQPMARTVYYDQASIAGHFEMWVGPYGDGLVVRFVDLRQVTMAPPSAGGTRLYDVLDALFDGFTLLRAVRDEAGRIVDFGCEHVNDLGARLIGRTVGTTIGQPLSVLNPPAWDNGLFERYAEVATTGVPWRHEMSYPAIGQVWEIKIGRAGEDCVAVSFREVTGQVEQRQQLSRSMSLSRILQNVTTALVAASTTDQVYTAIGAELRSAAGARDVAVLLWQEGRLQPAFGAGDPPTPADASAAARVARTGRPRFDPAAASALLPLTAAGETLGTLAIGYGESRPFDDDERAVLTALAGLSAQALQRALLFEARTSIAAALQHALLPAALPRVPGLRHAARYLPWTQGLDVGGDWYDVIPIADDVVGVVIGDVAGHNTVAAAAMGQVRNALRAYAVEGHDPGGVLHHANQLLCDMHLETMATCCYLELHPAEGTATAVLAGHPPPVLRTGPDAVSVPLRCGPPLGVVREAAYLGTTFLMPAGSTLLLFTDGLVEGNRHPIDRGMAELRAAVAGTAATDPERILDHILSVRVGPALRSDDVALLCLTNDAVPAGPCRVRRRFRGEALSASTARRFTGDILTAWGQLEHLGDALLLLGELITNAIQHTVGYVTVELCRDDDTIRVTVSDPSDRLPTPLSPEPDSESGRGLLIVERLARRWGTEALPAGGKRVWFELPAR